MSDRWRHTLPVEIVERIVTTLSWMSSDSDVLDTTGRSALLACALTCRALYPISRRALFSQLGLQHLQEIHDLAVTIHKYSWMQRWLDGVAEIAITAEGLRAFPTEFACRLPTLARLSIVSGMNHPSTVPRLHHSVFVSLRSFPSLSTLSLERCDFETFSLFRAVIRALPRLSNLELLHCRCMDYSGSSFVSSTFPRLASLRCWSSSSEMSAAVYSWLCNTSSCQSMLTLDINHFRSGKDNDALHSLMAASACSLIELDIWGDTPEDFADTLTIATVAPNLRVIRLQFYEPSEPQDVDPGMETILEEIPQWKPVEELLALEHFSQLEDVTIILRLDTTSFSTRCDESDVRDAVEARLPALCARGILKIEVEIDNAV